ncbi:MAG: DUF402 domain-containing protein [Halobacteriaceae archaeon]
MTRVRVRGIYATALTARLHEAHEVVQASPPIRRRFDADFAAREHDVRVETTDDRQGVEVSGSSDAVAAVRASLADVGRDALSWTDPVARGAVLDAVVDRAGGRGAVLDVGVGEAYLPYANAADRVEEGDALRVQVREPAPPWADGRAVVDTAVRIPGGLAELVHGVESAVAGTPDGTSEHELVRLTELLDVEVPETWGVAWGPDAESAGMDALEGALRRAVERSRAVGAALSDPVGDPGPVATPESTAWVWFGRESRFALDEERREVVPTMGGHHRIKAGGGAASDAVDFVERLCDVGSFPFDAVTAQFGPDVGDVVAIEHGKPEGNLVTLGRGEVTDRDPESETITVERRMTGGGTYDALDVPRTEGDVAVTKFREGRWWYPTVYRDESGTVKGTYLNVSTPVELFPDAVRYVDLHVDVIKHADGTVDVVDRDELQAAADAGHVDQGLADRAVDVAERVAGGLRN